MNDSKITRLKKRTFTDMTVSGFLAADAFISGIYFIITFIDRGLIQYLSNAVYSFAISIVLFLICLILADVKKNEKPFSSSIILKLRIIAVLLIIVGFVPCYAETDLIDNVKKAVSFSLSLQNYFIITLGVIIGIISEIFVYGRELQEDNDLIA